MARPTISALLLLVCVPGVAGAQPSVTSLRGQIEQLSGARPGGVPEDALTSLRYMADVAERIDGRFHDQSVAWRRRASQFLARARAGHDPFVEQRGRIVNRGYISPLSEHLQGYAVYLPRGYDPAQSWPLVVVLHGGSSNGNLFLGVVLGNNMSWLRYARYLWDDFTPRWFPEAVIVAPDGFGQVMWRWMGEDDVLAVIDDAQRNYNIDADRVVLSGLSNGGVGAYSIGTRHAWRFSSVQAMAGSPSWVLYAGGRPGRDERPLLQRFSAIDLAENMVNTDFQFFHGRGDTGPMRPRNVEQLDRRLAALGLDNRATWLDAGHDILYRVHRHGRGFGPMLEPRRNRRPTSVRVVTGDYRANRQHWLTVTRIVGYPNLARAQATVGGRAVTVQTNRVSALALDLRDMPLADGPTVQLIVDERQVYDGPRDRLGHVLHLARDPDGWRLGFPNEAPGTLYKRPGSSGPLTDAYHGAMVHVYGTQMPTHTEALERAARRGARGWPVWLWRMQHQVVADTEVTDALMQEKHLVLYGTAGDNAVLERMADRLPIQITDEAIVVGTRIYRGPDVGVRFIYPNPLAPMRYVVVQAAMSTSAVAAGHQLPDFLPDYVVYDRRTTRSRSRLTTGQNRALELGTFDDRWQLRPPQTGGQPGPPDAGDAMLPVPPAPRTPPPPRRFAAPASDPAGLAARQLAQRVRHMHNFRAEIPGARWRVRPSARWHVRPEQECYEALRGVVPFRPIGTYPTPVPSPVELTGPIDGVWFRMLHDDRPLIVSCEMAARLPALVAIVKRFGVQGIDIMSAYREGPRASFHTMGLGLDLARFWTSRGWLSVERDFEATPAHLTCAAPRAHSRRARALLGIACRLARSGLFSSVLTPNYNAGHRDHFHIDARPNDPRLFLR